MTEMINPESGMTLKLLLPTKVLLDVPVTKVIAEAQNGSFCLLPKHIDFVAALVPGILTFTQADGQEQYVAVDIGTLIKHGRNVLVSVVNAVRGDDLNKLHELVKEHFIHLDEQQRMTRSALARLEAGVMRNLIQLEKQRYG
ncbi:F0F1 ATP synthase subunit epsilon [uncultured Cocleimonas sp.]|uniref:F0F1 ATP synthase subunit epsilon n=1 Tax=uncultured Cocleimonas sp. TaxID=1051587 RepID=UPI00261392F3|nr:F0F1 ATP synthase subunit epsilon [uncultured Cocleimonas sp.]